MKVRFIDNVLLDGRRVTAGSCIDIDEFYAENLKGMIEVIQKAEPVQAKPAVKRQTRRKHEPVQADGGK